LHKLKCNHQCLVEKAAQDRQRHSIFQIPTTAREREKYGLSEGLGAGALGDGTDWRAHRGHLHTVATAEIIAIGISMRPTRVLRPTLTAT
jgi:hypothetical protein